MEFLPYEIIFNIISYLSCKDCISLCQTNYHLRTLCLSYLTRYNKDKTVNKVLKKMKKYNFYDYYILDNKHNKNDIIFNLYELKALTNKVCTPYKQE